MGNKGSAGPDIARYFNSKKSILLRIRNSIFKSFLIIYNYKALASEREKTRKLLLVLSNAISALQVVNLL